jgi:hypothetical protein
MWGLSYHGANNPDQLFTALGKPRTVAGEVDPVPLPNSKEIVLIHTKLSGQIKQHVYQDHILRAVQSKRDVLTLSQLNAYIQRNAPGMDIYCHLRQTGLELVLDNLQAQLQLDPTLEERVCLTATKPKVLIAALSKLPHLRYIWPTGRDDQNIDRGRNDLAFCNPYASDIMTAQRLGFTNIIIGMVNTPDLFSDEKAIRCLQNNFTNVVIATDKLDIMKEELDYLGV